MTRFWTKSYLEGTATDVTVPPQPLYHILDDAAARFGDFDLLDFLGKTYTYRDVKKQSDQVAKGLQKLGIGKGDKVGLFLPNSPYAVICYYGILKAGASVVNYNPLYVERELIHQIKDSETTVMMTMDLGLMMDKIKNLLPEVALKKVVICSMTDILPFPKNILFPLLKRKDLRPLPDDPRYLTYQSLVDNDGLYAQLHVDAKTDIAVLQYTGGTTGVPKGAMLSHYNLYANALQVGSWLKDAKAGEDSQIGVLPFFHVFAMTAVMNLSIIKGLKIYLQPKFEVKAVLKLIQKKRPSYFLGVPAIFAALANDDNIGQYDFSGFKYCLAGGAPLAFEVKRHFEEKTKCKVLGEGYGLTESSPVVCANPVDAARVRIGAIGLPLPSTDVKFVSTDDRVTEVPLGEKGELCVKGPQVMMGYYKKPDATAEVMKDGWLHTGDVGYIDQDGFVFLVDRIKDLILVRGYNVYPRMIEEAIYKHPSTEECIVAGVPDAERGESVWAWVKLRAGHTVSEEAMQSFLNDYISPIEMPRKIIFKDKPLPKTAVGKLSRKDLLIQEGIKK